MRKAQQTQTMSALESSREAMREAERRAFKRKRQLKEAGFVVNEAAHNGLRDAGLHVRDRESPSSTEWKPRSAGARANYSALYALIQRSDGGILGQIDGGGYQVHNQHSRNGRHAQVVPDDTKPARYRCQDAGCTREWCNHVDAVRIHLGLTRFGITDTAFTADLQPKEPTPPAQKPQKPASVQTEVDVGHPKGPEPRQQTRGERKRPPAPAPTPMPHQRVMRGVELQFAGLSCRLGEAVLSDVLALFDHIKADATMPAPAATLTALALAEAAAALPHGAIHTMGALLEAALPKWGELNPAAQTQERNRFSQTIMSKGFMDILTERGLKWTSMRDPTNRRVHLYGVLPC